jgi:two-component system C4-dicarboxylate transport sensor histidine kinase DctB
VSNLGLKTLFVLGLTMTIGLSASIGSWLGYLKLERDSRNELFRYTSQLQDLIDRFRIIPQILSSNPLFLDLIDYPIDNERVAGINHLLGSLNDVLDTSDIYIMDADGMTLAASNWNTSASFVGHNFDFRPYYQQAMTGQPGFYFALGTTSGVRGLFFSYPVTNKNGSPVGVLVVKVSVPELEQQWQNPYSEEQTELVVTDPDGVIFLSTRKNWRYKSVNTLNTVDLERIKREQRYGETELVPLVFENLSPPAGLSDQTRLVSWQQDNQSIHFIRVSQPMEQADWTVSVYSQVHPVRTQQLSAVLVSLSVYIACAVLWLYLRERSRHILLLQQSNEALEHRVAIRTQDLKQSNIRLQQEVNERQKAEQALRDAQEELIQTAKLATLGQMSASINHELNQPLTAVQAFSSNARKFLQKGQLDTVDKNLQEINILCQRMANIVSQLKVFARKSDSKQLPVDLCQSVNETLKIMGATLEQSRTSVELALPEQPVMVLGDMVRLEQILVNLVSNAIQAMEHSERATIRFELSQKDDEIELRVIDNGPGLPDNPEKLFTPFYTTKDIHQGLGLGLSISRQIAEAMNGSLTTETNPTKSPLAGAVFKLTLPAYQPVNKESDAA